MVPPSTLPQAAKSAVDANQPVIPMIFICDVLRVGLHRQRRFLIQPFSDSMQRFLAGVSACARKMEIASTLQGLDT